MAVGGINKWTPQRKSRGIRTRFSLSVENEQADAGRGQPNLSRETNSQARTGTGKMKYHEQNWQPSPVDLTGWILYIGLHENSINPINILLFYVITIHIINK